LPISWDTRASLHRASVRQLAPGQYAILWTEEEWNGSLAGMLREWLSKPEAIQGLYTIIVRGDAGTGRFPSEAISRSLNSNGGNRLLSFPVSL
jgi:hypothetical protein